MLAASAVGGEAAVAPPPPCQSARKVPGCRWLGFPRVVDDLHIFDGGAAARVIIVVGAHTSRLYVEGTRKPGTPDRGYFFLHVPP